MSASSKARRLIAWDRFIRLFIKEDELCGSPFLTKECQRRWNHHGLHAYVDEKTSMFWRLPA